MARCRTDILSILDYADILRLWLARPEGVYPEYAITQRIAYMYEAARHGWLWVGRAEGRVVAWAVAVPFQEMVHIDAFYGPAEFARAGLATLKVRHKTIHYNKRGGKPFTHKLIWAQA